MTLRECAIEIEPGATPARLHEIERSLHRFAHTLLFGVAVEVDNQAMAYEMNHAWEAARLLRDKAYEHLNQT